MLFRYLGIPLASEKLKVSCYAPFLDKIVASIEAWNCSSLSYAGKVELIRAVLQDVECFWLSIFPILTIITSRIISLCPKFLWGSKKPLVAWKNIYLPKEEGGLGLKDMKSWNLALLAKSLWNIQHKKDMLWIHWTHQVYLKGTCIWDILPRKDHSLLFKKLLEIRENLIENVAVSQIFSHGQAAISDQVGGVINLFVAAGLPTSQRAVTAQNSDRKQEILDRFKGWSTGDKFCTKAAYEFFRPKGSRKVWTGDVWKSCITPRHSFLLWLGVQSKLLKKDKLQFLDLDRKCVFCGAYGENGLSSIL
ncbi:uncharacterized protein LOC111365713 [Olea europaea var. sylvestris]|uniref:uncharacterized protein LOC111365713 n=1 Tax=Olea europaea var. sylvestris TaxID=158386 RepID=UPI000C1D0B43|nr:uncharacterized protein LOC111365713 [Olea europaea var. sylvestris]